MCGILGFVGESKNPLLSYEIMTNVFCEMESRGTDAAGCWATNKAGNVMTCKESIRASEFVKTTFWESLVTFRPDLLLCHARAASRGDASINHNNHPFLSDNGRLAVIHNGTLSEYDMLKSRFRVNSDCDSEMILRIIEAAPSRLSGVANVFSYIQQGHMAVAVGEVIGTDKEMMLFRNRHRPLWLIDLRAPLGQVFFCSTRQIWQNSLHNTNYKLYSQQKVTEVLPGEVWHFRNDKSPARYTVQRL